MPGAEPPLAPGAGMPLKRGLEPEEESNKKLRAVIDALVAEFVCPITQEIPVDPVFAEDGRIYERQAIEAWMARDRPEVVPPRSPVTNLEMGSSLAPAMQVRSAIAILVESGGASALASDSWRQRMATHKEVEETRCRAEDGDADAAFRMGSWYSNGEKGLYKNLETGFEFYKLGANLGGALALCGCAIALHTGAGVPKSVPFALHYYTRAAEAGCEVACSVLGWGFAKGNLLGLPFDENEARRWFERMPGCAFQTSRPNIRDKAKAWLAAH